MKSRKGDRFEEGKNSYFTSYSLKHPFAQCVDNIGEKRVAIWANDHGLPELVMASLKTTFAQSNRNVGDLVRDRVIEAEKSATALGCIILGKAPRSGL